MQGLGRTGVDRPSW